MSGPGAVYVGPRRSAVPASVSVHGALLRKSASVPSSDTLSLKCSARGCPQLRSSGPHFRSACHAAGPAHAMRAPARSPSGPRAPRSDPHPIQPGAFLFSRREPQTFLFGESMLKLQLSFKPMNEIMTTGSSSDSASVGDAAPERQARRLWEGGSLCIGRLGLARGSFFRILRPNSTRHHLKFVVQLCGECLVCHIGS